jgi:hypothetical protein
MSRTRTFISINLQAQAGTSRLYIQYRHDHDGFGFISGRWSWSARRAPPVPPLDPQCSTCRSAIERHASIGAHSLPQEIKHHQGRQGSDLQGHSPPHAAAPAERAVRLSSSSCHNGGIQRPPFGTVSTASLVRCCAAAFIARCCVGDMLLLQLAWPARLYVQLHGE